MFFHSPEFRNRGKLRSRTSRLHERIDHLKLKLKLEATNSLFKSTLSIPRDDITAKSNFLSMETTKNTIRYDDCIRFSFKKKTE